MKSTCCLNSALNLIAGHNDAPTSVKLRALGWHTGRKEEQQWEKHV